MSIIWRVLFVTVVLSFFCFSMTVIPERISVEYFNPEYLENVKCSVRKYHRKGIYYFNLEGTLKHAFGNNVSVDIVFYEFLHNEYRRSFVEFHFDHFCDALEHDPYLGFTAATLLKKNGLNCPIKPAHVNIANISIPLESFPYVWPFEKAKAKTFVSCNNRKTTICNGTIYVHFEQKIKKT